MLGTMKLLVDDVSGPNAAGFALPTGTVTFLLTDVEGSTRRWEDAPSSMSMAVPRHYEILDEAVADHGGVRPVEQGEGDSVVAAFARATDAVAAAVDAQRRFLSEEWPEGADLHVRMAVHTGEAQLRDEGNYFGQTVIRCARLRAIGYGDQILVSDATAGLVVDRLPEQAGLTDLGMHRLKDLGRPERVWQVVHPDLPATHPELRSLDAHPHNLPVQVTPLIGRDEDVAALARLVGAERLVTLTGSGGVGKTRLALDVAADLLEQFPGGVWFVELAGVADQGAVGPAVLAALGAHEVAGLEPVEQLDATLPHQPTLLVLDNCEHLVEPCARLTAGLLAQHGSVKVLATSREPLGVPGEVTWRVRSLSTPSPETVMAVPALSQYEAVRLFIDRARRARPTFVVDDANAPAIAQICHRLDGIPLALELAAARCRQMSVERIALELDDRFHLLAGGARTVLPRQQTLAASVEWSHDRLDESEQIVFRRLGVFAGVFPMEAAEAVASAFGDVEPVTVFDVVSRLIDKNLVVAEERPGGEQHYRLLETLRAYALNRVRVAGELEAVRDAHLTFWVDWLEAQAPVAPHRRRHRPCRAVPRLPDRGARLEHARPRGRAAPAAPARPPVARHRSAARRARRGRRAAHRRERRALPDALGRSRAVSGRPRRDFTRRARLGRVERARAPAGRSERRGLLGRAQRMVSRLHRRQQPAPTAARPRARRAIRRVPRHHPAGPSCRRDSERGVDHARRARPPGRGPREPLSARRRRPNGRPSRARHGRSRPVPRDRARTRARPRRC